MFIDTKATQRVLKLKRFKEKYLMGQSGLEPDDSAFCFLSSPKPECAVNEQNKLKKTFKFAHKP